jgi:cell division protein FtsI (penicillin-binding protein 3)/stage V sporulation protein D (sporulation-specific penicillin-binding protein)
MTTRKQSQKGTKKSSLVGSFFARIYSTFFGSSHHSNQRIWLVFICGLMLFVIVGYRLYEVQVVAGEGHRQRIDNQHSYITNSQDNPRGDVYVSYKDGSRILAATDREYYELVINNRNLVDRGNLRDYLNERTSYDDARLDAILQKKNDPYEILKSRISEENAELFIASPFRGVELHERSERYYPLDDLVQEIVGFVSFQEDVLLGTYGLEKYYDTILRTNTQGRESSMFLTLFGDKQEQVSGTEETAIEKNIAKEGSLVTTIEPQVQEQLLSELDAVDERFGSQYSAGIIMDPTSGQVVAMGSTKRFDPNENKQHYRNVIIEDRYEFGSIMKPLTVAMALDDGAIDADFQYNDRGFMKLNQRTINNYDRQGRGPGTTLQTILSQSLNTGAATIAIKLGADTFIEYVDALGLSKETGVDLPYEVYGNTENIDTGREVELATASFGQGIAVTLVEMARAWGALANDGIVKTPYVVDMIEYGDLIPSRNIPPGGDQQVFDIETIRQVTDMLISIVDDTATFRSYSLPQHSIAIKTGTAQLARPEGGYYDDEFLHTIAGYFPAQAQAGDQQFVMIIFTYQPQGAQYSSTTLKDAFFNVTQFMISYYNLTPDRNTSSLSNYETVQE